MTPSARHLAIRFWLQWTLAHGLCVGTALWFAAGVNDYFPMTQLWLCLSAILIACAVMCQQLMLNTVGIKARLWWLSSFLGGLFAAWAGTLVDDLFPRRPLVAPAIVFGVALGAIQSFACLDKRQVLFVWSISSGLAIAASFQVLATIRAARPEGATAAYLAGLLVGAIYGAVTGAGALWIGNIESASADSAHRRS